ncbi:ABC-three component system protein [Marinomonas gallaica]|uniref:ABC-three component system protein n=1 Tax=Marinomonas gallaica TaxID=1806667 RepID=UPI0018D4A78C|nr:ABC-three component system protein [Marinomonas gallaica]
MMDQITRAWYGHFIELELYRKVEQSYEDLFCQIMEKLHSHDFQSIKAAGSEGDGKADGYLCSEKTVFQSYAPSSGFVKSKLLKKISNDFHGAKVKWKEQLKKWTFIHNSWEGLPKYAHDLVCKLQEENPNIDIEVWGPGVLKDKALRLPVDSLVDLFGIAPTQADVVSLSHEPVKSLLRAIVNRPAKSTKLGPVSLNKLQFNNLSEDVETLLKAGRTKEALVNDLLSSWPDPLYAEELAEAIRERYKSLAATNNHSDVIFTNLQAFIGGQAAVAAEQVASLAVLSYFFERCDIFEDAPEGWSA